MMGRVDQGRGGGVQSGLHSLRATCGAACDLNGWRGYGSLGRVKTRLCLRGAAAIPAVAVPGTVPVVLLAVASALASVALEPAASTAPASAARTDLRRQAEAFRVQLAEKVLPYWYDTAIDWERGGYVLADAGGRPGRPATEKQIVTQARMVWGFAHAHLKGYRDGRRDYLKAAAHGYRFLQDKFLDPEHGGYYWKTDLTGQPVNDRKYLYGEAFVIYAAVEYHRASRDAEALRQALGLFETIQARCHDGAQGGWGEHYTRDWRLLTDQDDRIEVELAGMKSANAHLHWMEALAELYEATGDRRVKDALEEALRLNAVYFYPRAGGQAAFHRHPDWRRATGPRSDGLSYGHNVEFAWLMIRAEKVLGRRPSWDHFDSLLAHALECGYDHERGGLYNRGFGNEPATDTDKIWWVQSELLAALTDGLGRGPRADYERALLALLRFLDGHQIDPQDGIWRESVTAAGQPKSTAKAHNWKANYHDVRALVKFIEGFGQPTAVPR